MLLGTRTHDVDTTVRILYIYIYYVVLIKFCIISLCRLGLVVRRSAGKRKDAGSIDSPLHSHRSLEKLWFVDIVSWLCPAQLMMALLCNPYHSSMVGHGHAWSLTGMDVWTWSQYWAWSIDWVGYKVYVILQKNSCSVHNIIHYKREFNVWSTQIGHTDIKLIIYLMFNTRSTTEIKSGWKSVLSIYILYKGTVEV